MSSVGAIGERVLADLSDVETQSLLVAIEVRRQLRVAVYENSSWPTKADVVASDLRDAIIRFAGGDSIELVRDAMIAGIAELARIARPFGRAVQPRVLAPKQRRDPPATVAELFDRSEADFRSEHETACAMFATFRAHADLLRWVARDLPKNARQPVLSARRKASAALKRHDIKAASEALAYGRDWLHLANRRKRAKVRP
jgi:hypothetical protein